MRSVLLEFLVTDKETLIFIIRQDWYKKGIADTEPLIIKASFNEHDVNECVAQIRSLYKEWEKCKEKSYSASYVDQIRLEERTNFYHIGEKIFTHQLMQSIEGYELIYFVPFSALHHLPLHAMKYNGTEIIDKFACSYLPSASVLQFCNKSKERPKEFNLKGMGVDALNGRARFFIFETKKIDGLESLNKIKIYIQEDANRSNFFLDNEKFNILHCSSHAYFPQNEEDPFKSGIALYIPEKYNIKNLDDLEKRAIEDNEFRKNHLVDVNVLINELNTPFELVFISACVSGKSKNEAGDELIGLSRGLFYSGTKSMILSLFTAFKDKTGDYKKPGHVKEFYRLWIDEKQEKAIAFQNYIKILKDNSDHPFYWFGYILIGNPY